MFHWLSRLTLNQRLALFAVLLGAAAIAASPRRQGTVSINPQELALIVQRDADHLTARALADDLIKGQADFRVIDLRGDAAYRAYHLPTAESIPMASLASADLPRNEKFVLYADDGVHSAQGWFLLRARGHRGVYMLRGGLAEWKEQVLYPLLAPGVTAEERLENEQRAAVATHFGGAARPGVAGAEPPSASSQPAVAPPRAAPAPSLQLPPGTAKARAPVKRKEGC